jgi:hypothetical protein
VKAYHNTGVGYLSLVIGKDRFVGVEYHVQLHHEVREFIAFTVKRFRLGNLGVPLAGSRTCQRAGARGPDKRNFSGVGISLLEEFPQSYPALLHSSTSWNLGLELQIGLMEGLPSMSVSAVYVGSKLGRGSSRNNRSGASL